MKIICLVGPTGSGKTYTSVALAKLLKAEIDSFQSPEAYEAFLRNHLKYAAPDEILVIIIPKEKRLNRHIEV